MKEKGRAKKNKKIPLLLKKPKLGQDYVK